MTNDEKKLYLDRLWRQRPFYPFRLHLSDGRVFDVRNPELNMVLPTHMVVGTPEPDVPDPFAERLDYVRYELIDRIEVEDQPVYGPWVGGTPPQAATTGA